MDLLFGGSDKSQNCQIPRSCVLLLIAAFPHIDRGDEVDAEQLFPSRPRFSRLLFTTLDNSDDSERDTNVLTKATFDEIWDVADKVKPCFHA